MPAVFLQAPLGQIVTPPDRAGNTHYNSGDLVKNGANRYLAVSAGITGDSSSAPTVTSGSVTDGAVTWRYVGAAVVKMYKVTNSGQVDDMAYSLFENPTPDPPISITSVTLLLPQKMTVMTNGDVYSNNIFKLNSPTIYAQMTLQFG